MSGSPNIQYATPDPEYAALFASLPPSNFFDSVETGRKGGNDFMAMRKKQMEPELPDGVCSHQMFSTSMFMIIGGCLRSVEVQDDRSLGSRR